MRYSLRFTMTSCLLLVTLTSSTSNSLSPHSCNSEYLYPIAIYNPEYNPEYKQNTQRLLPNPIPRSTPLLHNDAQSFIHYPLLYLMHQKNNELNLLLWNPTTGIAHRVIETPHPQALVAVPNDTTGLSFVHNGRINIIDHIDPFNAIKPQPAQSIKMLSCIGPTVWSSDNVGYLHAKNCYHYGLYALHRTGIVEQIKWDTTHDYMYPQQTGPLLFYVKRSETRQGYSYSIDYQKSNNPPTYKEKNSFNNVEDLEDRMKRFLEQPLARKLHEEETIIESTMCPTLFLHMIDATEGFFLTHPATIDPEATEVIFDLYHFYMQTNRSTSRKDTTPSSLDNLQESSINTRQKAYGTSNLTDWINLEPHPSRPHDTISPIFHYQYYDEQLVMVNDETSLFTEIFSLSPDWHLEKIVSFTLPKKLLKGSLDDGTLYESLTPLTPRYDNDSIYICSTCYPDTIGTVAENVEENNVDKAVHDQSLGIYRYVRATRKLYCLISAATNKACPIGDYISPDSLKSAPLPLKGERVDKQDSVKTQNNDERSPQNHHYFSPLPVGKDLFFGGSVSQDEIVEEPSLHLAQIIPDKHGNTYITMPCIKNKI